MKNKDKFLREGVSVEELAEAIYKYYFDSDEKLVDSIKLFFNEPIKPTLTEDEKVILKNIETGFTHISRDYGDLFITVGKDTKDNECIGMQQYNHLFGFIKNGEEYSIEELLK